MRWCCLAIVVASCSTPPVGEVPEVDKTPGGRTDVESAGPSEPSVPSPAPSPSSPSPASPRPETGPDSPGPKDALGRPRRDSILAKGWNQFWEEDLERYPPHVESRRVLDTIDEADLLRYCLVERGLHPSAPDFGSGRNVAAYMEARGLGSPSSRAWTELLGLAQGKTSFDRAFPLLALYHVHSTQRRFREAGRAAERMRPEGQDLTLAFRSYVLAEDLPAARAVLDRLRRLEPPGRPDEETLRRHERTLSDLERGGAGGGAGGPAGTR